MTRSALRTGSASAERRSRSRDCRCGSRCWLIGRTTSSPGRRGRFLPPTIPGASSCSSPSISTTGASCTTSRYGGAPSTRRSATRSTTTSSRPSSCSPPCPTRGICARCRRRPAPDLPWWVLLRAFRPPPFSPRPPREVLADDNPWGCKLQQPKHLYNRGELHNLSVRRGTLNPEERYKINDHIIQTIIMLSALPYPRHLRAVPELAGGHHERMDGKGYPRQLSRDDMSPVARMMAVADIFEALTAADRPYKKGKTLSDAIGIMARMARDGHIDPDIFALFLSAGIYRDYAARHMEPEQIDKVKIEDYLSPQAAE